MNVAITNVFPYLYIAYFSVTAYIYNLILSLAPNFSNNPKRRFVMMTH